MKLTLLGLFHCKGAVKSNVKWFPGTETVFSVASNLNVIERRNKFRNSLKYYTITPRHGLPK